MTSQPAAHSCRAGLRRASALSRFIDVELRLLGERAGRAPRADDDAPASSPPTYVVDMKSANAVWPDVVPAEIMIRESTGPAPS